MRRLTKDASELKAIILHNLRDQPGCQAIQDVDLKRLEVREHGAEGRLQGRAGDGGALSAGPVRHGVSGGVAAAP
jgi:hypothetical protein